MRLRLRTTYRLTHCIAQVISRRSGLCWSRGRNQHLSHLKGKNDPTPRETLRFSGFEHRYVLVLKIDFPINHPAAAFRVAYNARHSELNCIRPTEQSTDGTKVEDGTKVQDGKEGEGGDPRILFACLPQRPHHKFG